jgi:hypothetical protein
METAIFEQKIDAGARERPAYAFCLYYGAILGKCLGYSRVSALELGVAGGNGLIALENYAHEIESELRLKIEIYRFDSGVGFPEPRDFRDIPDVWRKGFYPMDEAKLRARLNGSHLIIGGVSETAKAFFDEYDPAPVAAAFFDLDFYSSTVAAMQIFEGDEKHYLPSTTAGILVLPRYEEVPRMTRADAARWAQGLEAVMERIGARFGRVEPRRRARAYVRGLLSPLERKNGWQLVAAAGDRTPDGVQDFLARAHWEAELVRDELRAYVVAQLPAFSGSRAKAPLEAQHDLRPPRAGQVETFCKLPQGRFERGESRGFAPPQGFMQPLAVVTGRHP